MLKVGLTGGIGSGKTLVCSILEKLGVPVYYADAAARDLLNSSTELKDSIISKFGALAYKGDELNRSYMADVVFGDREKLEVLNTLVHPAVRRDFLRWTEGQHSAPYVVEEAAILFESGASREMDLTVLVYAPEALRIRRVVERDGSERDAVRRRMEHQMDEEEKKQLADHIINNDGTDLLLPQVIDLHKRLLNK